MTRHAGFVFFASLLAGVWVVSAFLAGGCVKSQQGPKQRSATTQQGGQAAQTGKEGEKVIQVTRNIGGREGFRLHWDAWKRAFEQASPGWKLELIDLGNADGAEFYKSRIATGDLPEVIQTWTLTNYLADAGHLVPLPDSYYEKFGLPLPTPYKGKRYASMGGVQLQGLVINKKMWDDVGITQPPATWDDFLAALHKLKEKGYEPLVYGGREWSAAQPLIYSIHVNMYDRNPEAGKPSWTKLRDQKKVTYSSDPTARKIMQNMIRLLENFVGKGAASDGYNEEQRRFYGGKAATWVMGCWIGGDVDSDKIDMDLEYWPFPPMTPDRKPIFICVSGLQTGWAITTSARGEKLEKALAMLEAFYAPEGYQLWCNAEAILPAARKSGVTGLKSSFPPAQRLYDNMAANYAKYGVTPGYFIALDDQPPNIMEKSMAAVMQEILAGNKDVDKLLKMLDDDWDSARKGM